MGKIVTLPVKRRLKIEPKENTIVAGDCLEWLKFIPSCSVDMCYIDPPFFSNKNYEIIWGNGYELRCFGDRWKGGVKTYIDWMEERVREIYKVLKDDGTIFLHCDWHASHRLRLMLDDVFGEKNFINEIVWYYPGGLKNTHKMFPRKHDTIFIYAKTNDYNFSLQRKKPTKDVSLWKRWGKYSTDGKTIKLCEIPATDKINRARQINKFKNKNKRMPNKNDVLYRLEGAIVESVWDDCPAIYRCKEKIGYPTQKPESLLKRIIECSTGKNGVVLDCFGGGGTTAAVAVKLGRKFITGDVSPVAVRVMEKRLKQLKKAPKFTILQAPKTKEDWLNISGVDFEKRICGFMGWEWTGKGSDGGVDGWAKNKTVPIQIKNHRNRVGRPDIQKFVGAMGKLKEGIFVAWDFAPTAWDCRVVAKEEHGKTIQFLKVEDILGDILIGLDKKKELEGLYKERLSKEPA